MIEFTIPGKAHGKGRPRITFNGKYAHAYTDQKTANYELLVQQSYFKKYKYFQYKNSPIKVSIDIFLEVPKSEKKSNQEMMLKGEILPTKKPDLDNVAKSILDALNDLAYDDDKQIVELNVTKRYSKTPYTTVRIEEVKNDI